MALAVVVPATLVFLVLLAYAVIGRTPTRLGRVLLYGLTPLAGAAAGSSGLVLLVLLGMAVNGGSCDRVVRPDEAGGVRIERQDMWGRRGMCLALTASGSLDLQESGYFVGNEKVAPIVFEPDGVGFRDEHGKRGPWLFLDAEGRPDPERTGWYEHDQPARVERPDLLGLDGPPGSIRPLAQNELEDLLLAWKSR